MDSQIQSYVALFYAIDRLYDEYPCDTTALCASELDPFLFEGIGSADPAHYAEFCQLFTARFPNEKAGSSEAYEFAREYANRLSNAFHSMYPEDETIADLFNRYISEELWLQFWRQSAQATKRLTEKAAAKQLS